MTKISKAAFLFLLTLFFSNEVTAQLLNVESIRAEADTVGWYGQLQFDFSINQYNDRVLEFTNESNISYFSGKHAYLFLNKLKLVNLDGASVINSGYSHARATFLRENSVSPEIFLQYQYNNNLGLENRGLAGIGFKYTFYESENWTGSFSSGVMAEYEEWKLNDQQSIENNFIKSTNNISMRGKISPQATFLLVGYYQARPVEFFKARSILESRLQVGVTKHVSLSISFVSSYDANPVIDIPKWTYELSNGILISF